MSKFQTTRWSLIVAARDSPAQARGALEQLCRAYRPPVFAFVRRSGYAAPEAEDLTQAFFLRFLERGWYADADPGRGRFRTVAAEFAGLPPDETGLTRAHWLEAMVQAHASIGNVDGTAQQHYVSDPRVSLFHIT